MISSYGDQSTTKDNPSYYYRASPTLYLNYECFQRLLPYILYMQLQHQIVILRNGVLNIFFTQIRSTEDHQQMFFIHFVAPCLALHLAVKY